MTALIHSAPAVVRPVNNFEYDLTTFVDCEEFCHTVWFDVFTFWDDQIKTEDAIREAAEAEKIAAKLWDAANA